MHRSSIRLVPLAVAALLLPRFAHAQAAAGAESISSGVANPERFLYQDGVCATCTATDVTSSPRPQDSNPEGVSFTDCEQNLRLDFTLVLSGFSPADQATVEAWAGTVDCTRDVNRTSSAGVPHACWQVASFYGPVAASSSQTITLPVFARDVLRYEAVPADAAQVQPYDPAFNSSGAGESACHVQPTDAAVPINLYFIPVDSTANAIGTSYEYALQTDLVAPAPPCNVTVQGGGDLLDVAWSAPAADPDRAGFDVWTAAAGEAGCDAITTNAFFVTGTSAQPACQRQGISMTLPALLAGTVDDPTATSFTQTGLHADARYAVGVAAIDGSGNVGPLSTTSCAETGAQPPAADTKVTAGCGCSAAGAAGAGTGAFAVAALALTCARRRRRRA